jgi:hypothetical protein
MYTLLSETTRMGNRVHIVMTRNHKFAMRLFQEAQEIDLEPEIRTSEDVFLVEFIADDRDVRAALNVAGKNL